MGDFKIRENLLVKPGIKMKLSPFRDKNLCKFIQIYSRGYIHLTILIDRMKMAHSV